MITIDYITSDGDVIDSLKIEDNYSLNELSAILNKDKSGKFPVPVIAFVGSQPAVKARGDWDIILNNTYVQFRQVVRGGGGGGSNPLATLGMLAVTALAIAAAVVFPPAIGLTGWMAMAVGGLAGSAILFAGNMLIGALFPQTLPSGQLDALNAESASPTYSINASGNKARLYQPEPEGFGRMKIVPDYIAYTWTEFIDNEEYGYFVYGIGRGEYEIESMSYGETEFWRNGEPTEGSTYLTDKLQVEIVSPNHAVTLFPDNVITSAEVMGQQLYGPNQDEFTGVTGPYVVNPPGTTVNKIALDFEFPAGIGYYNDEGQLDPYDITWRVEYQRIDDYTNGVGNWNVLLEETIRMGTMSPQRKTYAIPVVPHRYWVRARRVSDSHYDSGRALDTLQWTGLKGYLPGNYKYPITAVALYIKATNNLTSAASQSFSVIATRKLPVYNRETKRWSINQKTRSWAAAISHVLKCRWGGRLQDRNIDLDTLWAIDEELQAKGWYYDSYIDGAYLVWTLLSEMCQSQCVTLKFIGPIISFVMDMPNRPPTFALTPRNIMRDSLNINYSTWDTETPDDVLIQYLDAEYGFQQRDVAASLPDSNSLEPTNLNILGITSRKHAFEVAVAYAAHNRWQRISIDCQVEAIGHIINKGDICTITHPRFKNTQSGVLLNWNEKNFEITLQADILESMTTIAKHSSVAFMRPDGSIWGPILIDRVIPDPIRIGIYRITLDRLDYTNLLIQGYENPFLWFSDGKCCDATIWTLYSSRVYQRLMIVDEVKANDMYHYQLKLLNYDERIYQYTDLPIPVWQGRGQVSQLRKLKMPVNLRVVVNTLTEITVTWSVVAYSTQYEVEMSVDNKNFTNNVKTTSRTINLTVPKGRNFIRVRGINNSENGPWGLVAVDTTLPIPNPPMLSASGYVGGEVTLTWSEVPEATGYSGAVFMSGYQAYTWTTQVRRNWTLTPELLGSGITRELRIEVCSVNAIGRSEPAIITVNDPFPAKIRSGQFEIGLNYFRILRLHPDFDTDITGFAIILGAEPTFTIGNFYDSRTFNAMPFTWSNLPNGKHYFRLAARDQFWEIRKQVWDLNYSDVFVVDITGNMQVQTMFLEAGTYE